MIRPGRKQTNWQPHGYQGFGFFIHGLWSGSPPDTRGRSPVRKSRTPGSVRGVSGNGYPYRDIKGGEISASDGGVPVRTSPKTNRPRIQEGRTDRLRQCNTAHHKGSTDVVSAFLPVLRTLKGDFTRAAKGAVSPGVHIVIFSCDAFLLRISFR